jgi:hypothetical protein
MLMRPGEQKNLQLSLSQKISLRWQVFRRPVLGGQCARWFIIIALVCSTDTWTEAEIIARYGFQEADYHRRCTTILGTKKENLKGQKFHISRPRKLQNRLKIFSFVKLKTR